jgi:hypothetical protein
MAGDGLGSDLQKNAVWNTLEVIPNSVAMDRRLLSGLRKVMPKSESAPCLICADRIKPALDISRPKPYKR